MRDSNIIRGKSVQVCIFIFIESFFKYILQMLLDKKLYNLIQHLQNQDPENVRKEKINFLCENQ